MTDKNPDQVTDAELDDMNPTKRAEAIEAMSKEERERRHGAALLQREAVQPHPGNVMHVYADGSSRVGTPPFPDESPDEEKARVARGDPAPTVRAQPVMGQKAEGPGVGLPVVGGANTLEGLKERVEQQLTSDVLSGKDPQTPNPTTDSNKPELAGETPNLENVVLSADPTAEELQAIAEQIVPTGEAVGELQPTDEQKQAAVEQVLRETKGPVVDEPEEAKTDAPAPAPAAKKR